MVYLAGALVNAGLVDSFDGFLRFLKDHFAQHDHIDILPEGMQPKVLAIEHFHRQPQRGSIRRAQRQHFEHRLWRWSSQRGFEVILCL